MLSVNRLLSINWPVCYLVKSTCSTSREPCKLLWRVVMKSAAISSKNFELREAESYSAATIATPQSHSNNGSHYRKKSASSRAQYLQAMRNPPAPLHIRLSLPEPQARDPLQNSHPGSQDLDTVADCFAMGHAEQKGLQNRPGSQVTG